MKKIFFALFVCIITNASFATIHTVSNDPATVAQFSNLQAAIDAAQSGDTLYIHGSPTIYPSFTLTDKKLAFIGPGYAPEKELTRTAIIASGFVRNTAADGSSNGSEFNGLIFNFFLRISDGFTGSQSVSNLLFQRCQFNFPISIGTASLAYNNYIFESNYFNGSGIDAGPSASYSNFIFRNNVFRNSLNGRIFGSFVTVTNILVDHNLFYSSSSFQMFSNCNDFLMINNIIVRMDASGAKNTVFNNNITFNSSNNTPWAPGANNNVDGGGNVANQDPQMAAQTDVNNTVDNPLLDFSIAAGPANNSGSDGKDMGLLYDATGTANWANSRNSRLPRVTKMNILNPTIAPSGTLNVQLEAKVSN